MQFKKYTSLLLLLLVFAIAKAVVITHDLGDEKNGITLRGKPTAFPGDTNGVGDAEIYYNLTKDGSLVGSIAGMVLTNSSGEFVISFEAPNITGTYDLTTRSHKTGYDDQINVKTVNVYEGSLNLTVNLDSYTPYEQNSVVGFSGRVVDDACCNFKPDAEPDCYCQLMSNQDIQYYVDSDLIGTVTTGSDGTYIGSIDLSSYSAGRHHFTFRTEKDGYRTGEYIYYFDISSKSIHTISGSFVDKDGNPISVNLQITNSTGTIVSGTYTGDYSFNLLEGAYDFKITYGSYEITINSANINNDISEILLIDDIPVPDDSLPLTLVPQKAIGLYSGITTYNSITVKITYDDSGITESRMQMKGCLSWDYSSRICTGSWTSISATKDESANTLTASSSIGAFVVGEGEETCSSSNCDTACSTKTDCESVGCNWCGNYCSSSPCLTCHSSNLTACTNIDDCYNAGGYFCNSVCGSTPCCDEYHLSLCNQTQCESLGKKWCAITSSCEEEFCCSPQHLEMCNNETTCVIMGGQWCDDECKASCVSVNTVTTQYVYVSQENNTYLSFYVSVLNPYNAYMNNTIIKLKNLNESEYTVEPQNITIEPNTTQQFKITIDKTKATSTDYSYTIDYLMQFPDEDKARLYSFSNPLNIDWIDLYVSLPKEKTAPGKNLLLNVTISKTWEDVTKVLLDYEIIKDNKSIYKNHDQQFLRKSLNFEEKLPILTNYSVGNYYVKVEARIGERKSEFSRPFIVKREFPWLLFFLVIVLPIIIIISVYVYVKFVKKPPEYVAVPVIKIGK